ncbi:MAG TPA: response regulator transcription factor [Nocardioides sp.]|uniref:response regulator transcription factor n=1 Tax=Nocardioides sp. TaxID=35761 RepID=UPI002D80AE10|nr:response regulator transcription factor [Nocardioides sp.]HET6652301.1 response regulator transcription factor [Nocardioides sp.]
MSTVMVVDDQERMRTMLCRLLAAEGHVTQAAPDGETALELLADDHVDLVLLDLVMPGANGFQVLSRLRDRGFTAPVIVLSAVPEVAARVDALDLGAVDFVPKPFHTAELVARVRRSLASRPAAPLDTRYLHHGGVRLDLDRRRAFWRGEEVALSEREFELLAHLMRRHGRVCRRQELLHDVWGIDFEPGTNLVEVCVRRLRNKLPEVPIETVRSVGYCYTED